MIIFNIICLINSDKVWPKVFNKLNKKADVFCINPFFCITGHICVDISSFTDNTKLRGETGICSCFKYISVM